MTFTFPDSPSTLWQYQPPEAWTTGDSYVCQTPLDMFWRERDPHNALNYIVYPQPAVQMASMTSTPAPDPIRFNFGPIVQIPVDTSLPMTLTPPLRE